MTFELDITLVQKITKWRREERVSTQGAAWTGLQTLSGYGRGDMRIGQSVISGLRNLDIIL